MAGVEEDTIDFIQLEQELNDAIEEDTKYWRENDAKFRAVNQKVATYDEFRDIVKAAHLKPLEKSDKSTIQQKAKGSIWNTLASKKKLGPGENESSILQPQSQCQDLERLPATTQELNKVWKGLDICDRLALLKRMGPAALGHLFRTEIPVGLLGEILQTLLAFTPTTSEIIIVVGLMEALTEAKRFSLSLQFLSTVEKNTCKQLLEKLTHSLQDRQQDLAEEGITEWMLQELKKKYEV